MTAWRRRGTRIPIGALTGMTIPSTLAPDPDRLGLTEAALATADRRWRAEMRRCYGPDGVLIHGFTPEAQGDLGTALRRSYEARRVAVAIWRHERRRMG